jgi:regulation of enolase protein 1 (concanavalin A-like superfamily)
MSAEGADIYGETDEFRYAYKTLSGNGSITVRVDSIENANVWSKAGIMIRDSLDANSVHVTTVLAASGTAELESRSEKGGTTATTDVTDFGNPCWLRITRTGDDFTAELSKDGLEWRSFVEDANEPSTVTVEMGNTVNIGLAVTSHEADVLAAATFYNPTTTGNVSSGNWTVLEIGDTDQAEGTNTLDLLYVTLEDDSGNSATVYAPGAAVGSGSWMALSILYDDLEAQGVDVSEIKTISVGIGDPSDPMKGQGVIYLDDVLFGHPYEE